MAAHIFGGIFAIADRLVLRRLLFLLLLMFAARCEWPSVQHVVAECLHFLVLHRVHLHMHFVTFDASNFFRTWPMPIRFLVLQNGYQHVLRKMIYNFYESLFGGCHLKVSPKMIRKYKVIFITLFSCIFWKQ